MVVLGQPAWAAPWDIEGLIAVQPEQEIEVTCNQRVDCMTPMRSSFGGAVRGGYRDAGVWGLSATLGFAHASDQEGIPTSGYSILSLRLDFEVELGRTADQFGAALRVSPILVYGWHDDGSALGVDLPGFALLLGRTDLWGEVGVPTLPTPTDPRLVYVAGGWQHPWVSGVAGFGTFGTLGYQRDEIDKAGSWLGVFAHLERALTERFYVTLRLALTTPVSVALGFRVALE